MKNITLLFIIITLFSSCKLYKPGRANIPILEGKNDGNLSGSIGRNVGIEASYSPINHLGIIANYTNGFKNVEYQNDENYERRIVNRYNNQQYEFGLGYYARIDKMYYFEVYAGYGIGESGAVSNGDGFFYRNDIALEAMHEHVFIQPTFALDINPSHSFRLSAKLALMNFYDINSSPYSPLTKNELYDRTFTSIQPSVTYLIKMKFIDLSWQTALFISPEDGFYTHRWLNTSIGVGVNLSRLRKTIKGVDY
jgi:hypothetical protein